MIKITLLMDNKIKRKLWYLLVKSTKDKAIYPFIYRSYWGSKLHSKGAISETSDIYFSARPNPGAGIGHQLANWIAGYWWAKQLRVKFAHIPFSSTSWDEFLGFGDNEPKVNDLLKEGYVKRRLPLFNEDKPEEVERTKKIIASYTGRKVIFVCEQDQYYMNQYGVIDDIQNKFYSAGARKGEELKFSKMNYNIAIHVRRGDILADPSNPNLAMRYISADYFKNVLDEALIKIETSKPVHIYFFSQGTVKDFPEFASYDNLHWCLDMGAKESFLHMVYADLLITSKSSFSYKPALLNKNVKICPDNFWHGYPDSKDWIIANNEGKILAKSSN